MSLNKKSLQVIPVALLTGCTAMKQPSSIPQTDFRNATPHTTCVLPDGEHIVQVQANGTVAISENYGQRPAEDTLYTTGTLSPDIKGISQENAKRIKESALKNCPQIFQNSSPSPFSATEKPAKRTQPPQESMRENVRTQFRQLILNLTPESNCNLQYGTGLPLPGDQVDTHWVSTYDTNGDGTTDELFVSQQIFPNGFKGPFLIKYVENIKVDRKDLKFIPESSTQQIQMMLQRIKQKCTGIIQYSPPPVAKEN